MHALFVRIRPEEFGEREDWRFEGFIKFDESTRQAIVKDVERENGSNSCLMFEMPD